MYFEMVDEVDDARKYAQDLQAESVKEIHLSKKCTEAAKHVAVGRLEKWKYRKAKYYDVLHVMELERENSGNFFGSCRGNIERKSSSERHSNHVLAKRSR